MSNANNINNSMTAKVMNALGAANPEQLQRKIIQSSNAAVFKREPRTFRVEVGKAVAHLKGGK
jgi:hypothetical protein